MIRDDRQLQERGLFLAFWPVPSLPQWRHSSGREHVPRDKRIASVTEDDPERGDDAVSRVVTQLVMSFLKASQVSDNTTERVG